MDFNLFVLMRFGVTIATTMDSQQPACYAIAIHYHAAWERDQYTKNVIVEHIEQVRRRTLWI